MPFDGAGERNSMVQEELRVLLITRDRLQRPRHWIKGQMYRPGILGFCEAACLVGHMTIAAGLRPVRTKNVATAVKLAPPVVHRIAKRYNTCRLFQITNVTELMSYNDWAATEHKDVLRWLDGAIAQAQRLLE